MAEYLLPLYQGRPTDPSGELLFEVPASMGCIVKHVEIINVEPAYGLADTVTMWVVPPGEFPADDLIWIPETELGPSERLTWGGGDTMALTAGWSIWGASLNGASDAVLNVLITGMLVDEQPQGT